MHCLLQVCPSLFPKLFLSPLKLKLQAHLKGISGNCLMFTCVRVCVCERDMYVCRYVCG